MEHHQIKWKTCQEVSLMLLAYLLNKSVELTQQDCSIKGSPNSILADWAQGFCFSWGADRKLWGFRKAPFSSIQTDTTTSPPSQQLVSPSTIHALLHCSSMPQDCQWVEQSSKCQSMGEHLLVPVTLGVLVECWEHDGEDFGCVITDQAHDVFIVPVVQRSLRHLQWERKPPLKSSCQELLCCCTGKPPPSQGAHMLPHSTGLSFMNFSEAIHPSSASASARHFSFSWEKPHVLE